MAWRFWTSPENVFVGNYIILCILGDVQLGHLPTPDNPPLMDWWFLLHPGRYFCTINQLRYRGRGPHELCTFLKCWGLPTHGQTRVVLGRSLAVSQGNDGCLYKFYPGKHTQFTMDFNGILMGFHGILMGFHGISWDFNGILIGFHGISWWFSGI